MNGYTRERVLKLRRLLPLNDGTKLGAVSNPSRDYLDSVSLERLSETDARNFRVDQERITYVVMSYDTPIAWATGTGYGKDLRYIINDFVSPTTERHLEVLRTAWLSDK